MNISIKRAAIAQLCSTSNKLKNLQAIAKCAVVAKHSGAKILFCPENCGFMGSSGTQAIENGELIPNSSLNTVGTMTEAHLLWLKSLEQIVDGNSYDTTEVENSHVSLVTGLQFIAKHSGLWLSGCVHESGAPDNRVYNTHLIVDSDGKIAAKYRKIHLFDLKIPSQNIHLCESDTTAPGNKYVICDSPIGRLGLSICYDLRFSELYQELTEVGGADILLVPSAFTVPTGKAHWHTLLRARAIENQCWVIAAAQFGKHNEKRDSYGHSIVYDPWGETVCDSGGYDGKGTILSDALEVPSVQIFEIDENILRTTRERIPIRKHRKDSHATW